MRKSQAADDKSAETAGGAATDTAESTGSETPIVEVAAPEIPPRGGTYIRRADGTLEPDEVPAQSDKEA